MRRGHVEIGTLFGKADDRVFVSWHDAIAERHLLDPSGKVQECTESLKDFQFVGFGRLRGASAADNLAARHDSTVELLPEVNAWGLHDAVDKRALRSDVDQDARSIFERHVHACELGQSRRIHSTGEHPAARRLDHSLARMNSSIKASYLARIANVGAELTRLLKKYRHRVDRIHRAFGFRETGRPYRAW